MTNSKDSATINQDNRFYRSDRWIGRERWIKSVLAAAMVLLGIVGAPSVVHAQQDAAQDAASPEIAPDTETPPAANTDEVEAESAIEKNSPEAAAETLNSSARAAIAVAVSMQAVHQAQRNAVKQVRLHASIPGGTLALVAYFVLWLSIFGLVFFTMRRQRGLNDELAELGRRMDVVFEDLD